MNGFSTLHLDREIGGWLGGIKVDLRGVIPGVKTGKGKMLNREGKAKAKPERLLYADGHG